MSRVLLLDTGEATAPTRRPRSSMSLRRTFGGLAAILNAWCMAAARWYRIRRAIHDVAQHDDRMLKDIGIHRSEIERAVRTGRAR